MSMGDRANTHSYGYMELIAADLLAKVSQNKGPVYQDAPKWTR